MSFDPQAWHRFEESGVPIYVRADRPSWFVPNRSGDELLLKLKQGKGNNAALAATRFLQRLPADTCETYPGRGALLGRPQLRELWFHLTNDCNLSCRHCMFASAPGDGARLATDRVQDLAAQALEAGCRIFALTGGEPLMHADFRPIVRQLLQPGNTHVAVLTNGLLLRRQLADEAWDFERLHLQISLDGLQVAHDRLRGRGAFARVRDELTWLQEQQIPFTLSMCVTADNLADMPGVVDFAAEVGAGNVHFMWYFIRGRGAAESFARPEDIFPQMVKASARADAQGVVIDNLIASRSQIFAPAGTVHDGSGSGWESAAVGVDGRLYPSAALVGVAELATGLESGLMAAWQDSPVLQRIRQATAAGLDSPWRLLLGGGDLDHSYLSGESFIGDDPYSSLHEQLARWQIVREALPQTDEGPPRLRLKMGDVLESCGAHGAVALVHSNCLLSLAQTDSRTVVQEFYREAAEETKEDILNPVCYDPALIEHIPAEYRFRGYGCGSPVLDAKLQPGERVVDLGCGRGVECFIAALQVGPQGRAIGIDMLDNMLTLAGQGATAVAERLGYKNLEFHKGYLESLPLKDGTADVVLSNCVMNLSTHKRRAFAEIHRVLQPGGRLVISDVVCEQEPSAALRNDELLRGECIAGALTQKDLVGILEESGFIAIRLIKRFPYRVVQGHPFFSLTFEAFKANPTEPVSVIYRGPFATVITDDGQPLVPGQVTRLDRQIAIVAGDSLFQLDGHGAVTNLDLGSSCCALPTETHVVPEIDSKVERLSSGCMVCGKDLRYLIGEEQHRCSYCQEMLSASAVCEQGHFVCDRCHAADALQVIERLTLLSTETDLLGLFEKIRSHPAIPANGPEYHALVPAVILAVYRNSGGQLSDDELLVGLRRGTQLTGGSCAFWGVCGAAAGVGIAFSLILKANPLDGPARQAVQDASQQVLSEISALPLARCCRRDCWLALQKAADLSSMVLPVALKAEAVFACDQTGINRECAGALCPWFPVSPSI
ncbi:MAG: methyltransferase type 11 [Desulfuromonadales bacterium C00003096]|nr:MAG: methyltransferase type 11 [Desulfuromonadales bacterium C00003096]